MIAIARNKPITKKRGCLARMCGSPFSASLCATHGYNPTEGSRGAEVVSRKSQAVSKTPAEAMLVKSFAGKIRFGQFE
jgi:hypothetical protein